MFNPEDWEAVLQLEDKDLASLPSSEDERHEYKSSATKDGELADKLARAACAFWNSGGGLFIAGVNGSGQPDGGVSLHVGRQSRRDWIDQVIAQVSPRAPCAVKCIEDRGAGMTIGPGNAVIAIAFPTTDIGPHMAPDNRYYIRAGAHTLPASHFIVEAIRARRGLLAPMLSHVVRRKPEGGGVLQLGILALNDAPALNVEINLAPVPEWFGRLHSKLPLVVPVISRDAAFYLDFHILTMGQAPRPAFQVQLRFNDLAGRPHSSTLAVDVDTQMGPSLGDGNELRELERAVTKIADAINRKR
jgi:hypothetical protein